MFQQYGYFMQKVEIRDL